MVQLWQIIIQSGAVNALTNVFGFILKYCLKPYICISYAKEVKWYGTLKSGNGHWMLFVCFERNETIFATDIFTTLVHVFINYSK
jgi:hypothetical protein